MNTSKSDGREHTNLATSRAASDVSKEATVIPAVAPGAERRGDSGAKLADADSGAPSARPSRRGFLMNSIVSTASLATATALTTVPALAGELPAASIGEVSFPDLVAQFIRVRQRWAAQRGRDDEHAKKVDDAMFEATGMTSKEFYAIPYGDPRWEGIHAAFNKAWKEAPDPDPVDEHGASIEWDAILDQLWPVAEEAEAERQVIRAPAKNLADVRLRALVMRQIIIDAEELGEPGDNRHHAALDALIADIFNDRLMDGEAQ